MLALRSLVVPESRSRRLEAAKRCLTRIHAKAESRGDRVGGSNGRPLHLACSPRNLTKTAIRTRCGPDVGNADHSSRWLMVASAAASADNFPTSGRTERLLDRRNLATLVSQEAQTKIELPDIVNVLIEELVRRRYGLPPLALLQRVAAQARNEVNEAIYSAISDALDESLVAKIDAPLVVHAGKSGWDDLKRMTRFRSAADWPEFAKRSAAIRPRRSAGATSTSPMPPVRWLWRHRLLSRVGHVNRAVQPLHPVRRSRSRLYSRRADPQRRRHQTRFNPRRHPGAEWSCIRPVLAARDQSDASHAKHQGSCHIQGGQTPQVRPHR
ncbi:hypothetical protein BN2476_610020 [Paraburkholderia piptadeniae]|uniref:Uncharacterized protein n=1 Tax=Paraburkholderia piptadeniae TaxID=1701573 RepID=A0A1N7SKJ5_9BURK|nr:hypothetical protein BN2476_610020 [Paraburkholderia piptadeniae]